MNKTSIEKNKENNIKKLNNKIEIQMKKAFYNLLIEKTSSENPDFDWLVKLYSEIRDGLTKILKQGSYLRNEIEESLDVELFNQMIRNHAFKGEDMIKLINYTFEKLLQLGSAARDNKIKERRDEILDVIYKDRGTFGEIVGIYLKNAHLSLEELHFDLANLKKTISNIGKK